MTEQALAQQVDVRLAQPHDIPAIAVLLTEGFGQRLGSVLNSRSGREMYECIYGEFPERLAGLVVAVDDRNVPVAMAGLRTSETQLTHDRRIREIMWRELGIARMLRHQLRVRLTTPPPYAVQRHEAYIHSMTVTASWRGRGVAGTLICALHAQARQRGKTTMVVQVEEHNIVAHRLYARQGYIVRECRHGRLTRLPFGPSPLLLLETPLVKAE